MLKKILNFSLFFGRLKHKFLAIWKKFSQNAEFAFKWASIKLAKFSLALAFAFCVKFVF